MRPRPIRLALVLAVVLASLLVAPASATRPVRPEPPMPSVSGERPLTAEEQAASDRKVSEALAYVAALRAAGAHLLPLACATPNRSSSTSATTSCTTVPQDFLPVTARDQIRGHYCGPAVGQVIANYTWKMAAGADKHSQTKIAGWMRTDINGSTDAPNLEVGLEAATSGGPRKPAGWDWVVTNVRDNDGDGTTGDELHAFVVSNVSRSRMPLAVPVKPHDPNSQFNLSSWPNPVASMGHWIAVYGWYGHWSGNDFARTYFTDSSRDEGGSTGQFWNSTKQLAALVAEHTKRLVW